MLNIGKILELWFYRQFDLIVYVASVCVALGWFYSIACRHHLYVNENVANSTLNISTSTLESAKHESGIKYILEWVGPHTLRPFWDEGQNDFLKRNCKITRCHVTKNRTFLNSVADFDAVVFYGSRISSQYIEKPSIRSRSQKYVFVSTESSFKYPICDAPYDGFFNWTWSYKLDSDVPGYITIRNTEHRIIGPGKSVNWIKLDVMKPIDDSLKAALKAKTRAAAWIVSNRYILRQTYNAVRKIQLELRKWGLKIDIYVLSEDKNCVSQRMGCVALIRRRYHFYLAMEICFGKDYVTDKLLLPLQNYAIPVVFGGANYTRFMPDGIYLHAGQMSPAALAKEMHDIMKDKERYYSFFKWRNHYTYHGRDETPESDDHCKMCEMLHNETLMNTKSVYTHFRRWWNDYAKC